MRTRIVRIAVAVALLPAVAHAQVWNAIAEFSNDNGNPNGVWSYGYMPVGFGPLTLITCSLDSGLGPHWCGFGGDGTPGIWRNDSLSTAYGIPPGYLSLHPGPSAEPCILRWTMPDPVPPGSAGAPIRIAGTFGPGDLGQMTVAVRVNGQQRMSAEDSGAFDITLDFGLEAGGTIDFAVYGEYLYGNTSLVATIELLACPADFNGDGFLDFFDADAYVACFEGTECPPGKSADFNGDGFADFLDYAEFIDAFEAGC